MDLVAFAASGLIAYSLIRGFFDRGATDATIAVKSWFVIALMIAMGAASIAQLAHGRTDPKRGHAALSMTLWSIVGAALVVTFGYSLWYFGAKPTDLKRLQLVHPLPGGARVLITGAAPGRFGYVQDFVIEPSTGDSVTLPGPGGYSRSLSSDGKRMAWMQPEGVRSTRSELMILDLEAPSPRPRGTSVFGSIHESVVLSADGQRAALLNAPSLSVYDLASSRSLFSGRLALPKGGRVRMTFVNPDTLRVALIHSHLSVGSLSLFDLDIPARKLNQKLARRFEWQKLFVSASPTGDRLLLRGTSGDPMVVIESDSGRTVDLPASAPRDSSQTSISWPALLSDGRVVVPRTENETVTLLVWGREGALERTIPLGSPLRVWVGREVSPGKILVSLLVHQGKTAVDQVWDTVLVDVDQGNVARREKAVRFTNNVWDRWHMAQLVPDAEPFSAANTVLVSPDSTVIRWDALTGDKRVLFAPK